MSRACSKNGCSRPVTAAVTYSPCNWPRCSRRHEEVRLYCAQCDDMEPKEWFTCRICDGPGKVMVLAKRPAYDHLRAVYLDTFLIADKEAMLDAVTLDSPAKWDIWGSVLTDSTATRERRNLGELTLSDQVWAGLPVWAAGVLSVTAALALLTIMWVFVFS